MHRTGKLKLSKNGVYLSKSGPIIQPCVVASLDQSMLLYICIYCLYGPTTVFLTLFDVNSSNQNLSSFLHTIPAVNHAKHGYASQERSRPVYPTLTSDIERNWEITPCVVVRLGLSSNNPE